jgi:RNA polymerase sigma-70 factor (ECF subfamily)
MVTDIGMIARRNSTAGIVLDITDQKPSRHELPSEDRELIERSRDGDQGAFRSLVERYQGRVATTAVGMLGPGEDSEDVGQETFIRFYAALDSFRGESRVDTYLVRIAINLSLTVLKQRRRRRWFFPDHDATESTPDSAAAEGTDGWEKIELVRHALGRLSPEHRSVVVLRLQDGYSTKETAEILGLPIGTVLSRLARAQEKLKKLLRTYGYNE